MARSDNEDGSFDAALASEVIAAANLVTPLTSILKPNASDSPVPTPAPTKLCDAARRGRLELARTLLDEGASPHEESLHNTTPLHHASRQGHTSISKLLITKGAVPNAQTEDGWTPLHEAAFNGFDDIVCLLLECFVEIEAKNSDGKTAMILAAGKGHARAMRLLLEYGANLNATDGAGWTALHHAVCADKQEIVDIILCEAMRLGTGEQLPDLEASTDALVWVSYITSLSLFFFVF